MRLSLLKKCKITAVTGTCILSLLMSPALTLNAASLDELTAARESRMSLPVQTNEIENWPQGPAIGAQSAILMEATTGTILYAKNIHEAQFPASTTKILTCLVAVEHAALDEVVTFSREAVFSIPRGSSNMGMDAGQAISLQDCLYGILVGSANEVSNAVAEHVGGSIEGFAKLMNEKARELGCEDSNFANANGLHDDNHYTSAYDLATIARAFYQNELLAKISNTPSYHFEPTPTQPDDFILRTHHKLVTNEYKYEGIQGGKTGYTDMARQTLVTCAEQNGMKLICIIMKEESPNQFADTIELFNYGFSNFQMVNVMDNETKYNIDHSDFFQTKSEVFGSTKPILSVDTESNLVLPKTAVFTDTESAISYHDQENGNIATIEYTYNGAYVGSASINTSAAQTEAYDFTSVPADSDSETVAPDAPAEKENVIFVNIKKVLLFLLCAGGFLILLFVIRSVILNYSFSRRRKSRLRRRRRRSERIRQQYKDFDL